MDRALVISALVLASCGQTNGDPAPPTVVTATTTATSPPPPPPPADAASDAPASCAGYAAPGTPASCHAPCGATGCNANGCYGSYWCDLATGKCVPKPASCP